MLISMHICIWPWTFNHCRTPNFHYDISYSAIELILHIITSIKKKMQEHSQLPLVAELSRYRYLALLWHRPGNSIITMFMICRRKVQWNREKQNISWTWSLKPLLSEIYYFTEFHWILWVSSSSGASDSISKDWFRMAKDSRELAEKDLLVVNERNLAKLVS